VLDTGSMLFVFIVRYALASGIGWTLFCCGAIMSSMPETAVTFGKVNPEFGSDTSAASIFRFEWFWAGSIAYFNTLIDDSGSE